MRSAYLSAQENFGYQTFASERIDPLGPRDLEETLTMRNIFNATIEEDQRLVPGRSFLDGDDLKVLVRLQIKILSTGKKLTFRGFHWSFSVGITGFTNLTNQAETTSRRTILSPIKNHLQV